MLIGITGFVIKALRAHSSGSDRQDDLVFQQEEISFWVLARNEDRD